MSANTNFFTSQQPAAVFKLKVLEDYLTPWAMKVASKAPREVAYVDGYAGAGQYDDAHKGSPLYAVDIARKLAAQDRIMHIHLVERDRAHAETLRHAVAAQGQGPVPSICTTAPWRSRSTRSSTTSAPAQLCSFSTRSARPCRTTSSPRSCSCGQRGRPRSS